MGNDPLRKDHIFNIAAEISDPELRAAYLDEACGDDSTLREQVERLLRHDQDAGSFLESPASAFANTITPSPLTEKAGTVIGPYKLLQQIGEGGFGVVYMAEQTEPVRRKVALKIIKPGMDTKEVIARFEAERQALALMDHPNIAKVLDAGATESGRPYFVMELVKGVPVIEYCDKNHLPARQRLKLFVDICHAIQHAHQKGVIHRDLKPSNIMVTLHDGKPVPKVIDFGVAKALSQQLTEKTLFTAYGQMVGTPAYMSPEQAEMSGLDIDTRSDVYSLGVLLYELLTGGTPFDARRLREAGFAEMQRIIREEEPVRPSTRLTTMGEESTVVSSNRGTDPKKLGQLVRGELDWIVMKALDKERNRRYETANGFAADIERFLADEPVEACPPSAAYRFRKFARRNKAPMAVAATAFAVLLVVAIGSMIVAGRFRRLAQDNADLADRNANLALEREEALERERVLRGQAEDAADLAWTQTEVAEAALEREQEQTRIAEDALEREAEERERAQANFALARSAVDQFLNEVTDTDLLTVPGLQPLRQKLLSSALGFYEDFAQDEENATELLVELASAHYRIGLIRRELGQADEARASNALSIQLFEQLRDEGNNSVEVRLGLAKARFRVFTVEQYEETVTLCREILESHPQDAETRRLLGDTYNSLATNETNDEDVAAALAYHQQALELREGLVEEFPDNVNYLAELGGTVHNIGLLLGRQQRYREAFAMYERAVAYDAEAYQKSPETILWGRWLCIGLETVANYQKYFGEQEAALQSFQRLVSIRRKMAFDNPAVPSLKGDLYRAWLSLGNYQQELGQAEEARRSFDAARDVLENIPHETPDELFGLATVYAALAAPVEGSAEVPEEDQADVPEQAEEHRHYAGLAVETLRQAVDAGYRDLEALRSNPQLEALRTRGDLPELALLEVRLENEQLEADDLLQADETASDEPRTGDRNRAARLLRDLAAGNALDGRDQQTRAATLHAMGVIQTGLKQYEQAEQTLNEALRLRQELLTESSENLERRLDLLTTRSALGRMFWNSGRKPEAHRMWQECLAGFQRLADDVPQEQEELLKQVCFEERQICESYARIGLFENSTRFANRYREYEWVDLHRPAVLLALAGDFDAHRSYTPLFSGWYNNRYHQLPQRTVLWVASMSPDAGLTSAELKTLIEQHDGSTHFWPRFLVATGEYRAGQYQQALDRLETSGMGETYGYRNYWRSLILEKLGRHFEAVDWLAKAEEVYQRHVMEAIGGDRFRLGTSWWFVAYTQLMRREAWSELEGHAPDDPWQHLIQARAYHLIGEIERSDQVLAAVLATTTAPVQTSDQPTTVLNALAVRCGVGQVHWQTGRQPEAQELWQQVMRGLDELSTAHRDDQDVLRGVAGIARVLADLYGQLGLWDRAREGARLNLALEQANDVTSDARLAFLLAVSGALDEHRQYGRIFAERWGETHPAAVLSVTCMVSEPALEREQLLQFVRGAYETNAEDPFHHVSVASAYYRLSDYEGALHAIPQSTPLDNGLAESRDYLFALICHKLERQAEAERLFQQAEEGYRQLATSSAEGTTGSLLTKQWWRVAYLQVWRREAWHELRGAPAPDPWQHLIQARAYQLIGEDEQADQEIAAALVAASDPASIVSVLDSFGDLKAGFAVAEESLREQLELRQQILAVSDDSARAELDVLKTRYAIGKLYWVSDRLSEAHQLWQQLLPDVPAVSEALRGDRALWREALQIERDICNAYGRIGLWELAAQHSRYDIQVSRERANQSAWMSSALAALGRMEEYREYHEFFYTQYQNWGAENWDPWLVVRMTWHAGLLPEPTIPPERLVAVTREAFDATPGWDWFPLTLALASLRNGQFEEVLALLDGTEWAQADDPKTDHLRTLFAPYLRAMAHRELQQFDEAQRMLDAAEQRYREICQATIESSELRIAAPISDEWHWLAFAQQLRREAREKLDGAPPPDDPWQHLIQARGYRLIGEHEQADRELAAAIPVAAHDSEAWRAIARLADAEDTWQAALERSNDDLHVLLARGRWYAQRGEQEKADADFARAATLTPNELNRFLEAGWWVAGPYPPTLDEVCPPELDPDPSQPVHVIDPQAGLSNEPVAWRTMPTGEAGRIDLSTLVANGQDASFYALANVYSPDERTATLRTDQDLPLRVWVNGVRCPTIGPASPDLGLARSYYFTPLTLRAGCNTLLLKLVVSAETPPVWVRLNDHPVERAFDLARAGLTDEAGDVLAAGYSETHVLDWNWLLSKYRCGFRHHPETLHTITHDLLAHGTRSDAVMFGARLADCPVDRESLSTFAANVTVRDAFWRAGVAKVYARLGQWEDVLSVTDEGAAEEIPLRAMAYHHLGQHERARERVAESIDRLQRKADGNADTVLVRFDVSRVFVTTREACALILGNTEQVDALYDDFQQIRREMWQARDATTEAFDDLVAVAPDDPQAWLARGRRLAELGRLDEAEADFNTAVELVPDDPYVMISGMLFRADRGDLDGAVQDYVDVDRLAGGDWSVLNPLALEVAARPELFERVVATRLDDRRLWVARMVLLAWEGDLEAAHVIARRMEQHVSDKQRPRGAIALLRNDTAEWERIRDSRPQAWDPGDITQLLMLAPTAEPLTGELLSAAEWSESNVPSHTKGYWQSCMGVALFRAGRLEEARRKLEPLITTDMHAGRIWPVLAMIDYRLGDVEQARSLLHRSAAWMESHGPDARFATRRPPAGWDYWFEAAVFQHEATQLIKGDPEEPADELAASAESETEQEESVESPEPE